MDYRAEIIKLYNSDAYHRLSDYYGRRSMMDIVGMSRREEAHSNFLAWIFEGRDFGCGYYALKKLLQSLVIAKSGFSINAAAKLPEDLMDTFVTDGYDIKSVSVSTEIVIPGSGDCKSRRIDILLEIGLEIDGRDRVLPIVIENKVKSQEHTLQTVAYRDWAYNKFADRERFFTPICVFLTPDKTGDMREGRIGECACSDYIRLNYQYMVDYVLEPLKNRTIDGVTRSRIEDYLRCLSYANVETEEGVRGDLVMAITSKERELLRQFWKNNKALLSAAMEALSEDEDCTDEEKQAFKRVSETTSQRDYSKYRLEGDDELYGKRGIVGAVLREYFKRNPTLMQLKRDFPDSLHAGGFSRLAQNVTQDPIPRYFDPVTLSDGNIVVCSNQWGVGNIGPFLSCAEGLGFKIERC